MSRRSEHLHRRQGIYYLRLRVPDELRPIIGKREIKRSLKTADPSEAKRRIALERFKAHAELDEARRKLVTKQESTPELISTAKLTDADLWSLMACWFVQQQKADENLGPVQVRSGDLDEAITRLTDPEDTNALAWVHSTTRKFLAGQHINLSPQSEPFRRLQQLIHEAMIERERRLARRFLSGSGPDLNPRFAQLTAATEVNPGSILTLSGLIRRYERDQARAPGAPKTRMKRTAQFRLFKEVLGANTPIDQISREKARKLFDAISRLPANSTKRFKHLTTPQILQLPPEKLGKSMSATTANSYMAAFTGLMEFALNEHLVERNPAKGLRLASDGIKAKDKRLPFSGADLQRIFTAPLYVGCEDDQHGYARPGPNRPRRGRFWVPLIALFSGMRLNEICQLSEDDIAKLDGHDVFFVRTSEDGTKRVKTHAGVRIVPVHPELQRLGFLDFTNAIRHAQPAGSRLFAELSVGSMGYASDPFSKWFARFLDHIEVKHQKKNFHSFRHNFRDALLAGNVPQERARLLGGWSNSGTDARYGGSKTVEAAILAEEIRKIKYPSLNLDHLVLDASHRAG